MKKAFCILVLLVFVTGFALADSTYTMDKGKLNKYEGSDTVITVPSEIDGEPVTILGQNLFGGNKEITSVTLNAPLSVLDPACMSQMKALSTLNLPDTLVIISDNALLSDDALTELTIPPNVSFIGPAALAWCKSLQTIRFQGAAPVVGRDAFSQVPSSCVYLVPEDQVDAYRSILPEGADIRGEMPAAPAQQFTPPDDAFTITEDGVITSVTVSSPRLDIPAQIQGIPVRGLDRRLFEDVTGLYMVRLPEGLEFIDSRAFAYCTSLVCISLPGSLRSIGEEAFQWYTGISIDLPEGLTAIGSRAFFSGSLTGDLKLPSTLESIGAGAFAGTPITSLSIPASVREIGESAFACRYMKNLTFESMEPPASMDPAAFQDTRLELIEIPLNATRAQAKVFQDYFDAAGIELHVRRAQNPNVSLASSSRSTYEGDTMTAYEGSQKAIRPADSANDVLIARLGDGALAGNTSVKYFAVPHTDAFTTIGNEAFAGSVLEHVDLFDSVTDIGDGAFRDCASLQELTLPESLQHVGQDAFAGLTGLTALNIYCDPSVIPDGAFRDSQALASVVCPGSDTDSLSRLFALQGSEPEPEPVPEPEPEPAPAPEPEPEPAGQSESVLGTWYLISMVDNGQEINPATYGVSIVLELLEDGSFTMDTSWGPEQGTWAVQGTNLILTSEGVSDTMEIGNGTISGSGMTFGRTMPETASYSLAPVIDLQSVDQASGTYAIAYLDTAGLVLSAEDLLNIEFFTDESELYITIADGVMTGAGIQETLIPAQGRLTDSSTGTITVALHEDGVLTMQADDVIFVCTPVDTGTPEQPAVPDSPAETPVPEASGSIQTDVLYTISRAVSGDTVVPKEAFGDGFSVRFNSDGSLDLSIGSPINNLRWTQDGDNFIVNYFGVSDLVFSMVGPELHVNFLNTLEYYFLPQ